MSKTTGIKAVLLPETKRTVSNLEKTPGSYFYYTLDKIEKAGILHSCPCGCKSVGSLNFVEGAKGYKNIPKPVWRILKEEPKLEIKPSIGIRPSHLNKKDIEKDGFHWHGYIRNGKWESI